MELARIEDLEFEDFDEYASCTAAGPTVPQSDEAELKLSVDVGHGLSPKAEEEAVRRLAGAAALLHGFDEYQLVAPRVEEQPPPPETEEKLEDVELPF